MNEKDLYKSPSEKNLEENSESNSMNSLMEIKISKNISKKEVQTKSMNNINSTESNQIKDSENSNNTEKKQKLIKRHRRGKSISDARYLKCPECQKTYLSVSAL